MSRDTDVADRTASIESAFAEQPRAQLPAEIQQVMIDERPRGAISVHVKRDELEVLRKIKVIASAAGDDFFYSWPTKNKDGSRGVVEGPSVKCANAVARIFGNCSVKVRVFDQGAHWIFYAQFYDLETGFVLERPFQQRKGQNVGGGMDKDRATDIIFQIGTSKAARNVVCNALSEFTDYAFAVAKEQLVEKVGRNLEKFREQVADRLRELKVELPRVEQVRGKVIANWLAPDVAKVIAEIQAVNDGMAHPEELWPLAGAGAPKPQPEDFKPDDQAGKGSGENGGTGQQQAGQQPGTGKPAAAEAPKPAGQPAASPEAQAANPSNQPAAQVGAGEQTVENQPAGGKNPAETQEKPPGEQGAAAEAGDPDKAGDALAQGEAVVQRGIDNLQNMRTPEEIDAGAGTIVEILKEIENLDPEDLALLRNRWNTAQLERKREMGRKGRTRPR